MTPLLSFAAVSKTYRDGGRSMPVLDRVSLELGAGASLGVYGARRSGKSTLLRLAAGLELADSGSVRFDGRDLAAIGTRERGRLLRADIAYLSAGDWHLTPGERVVDHVATSLGSHGLTIREARRRALENLERLGVGAAVAQDSTSALSVAERMLVMLARALARDPRLLVLDEPALMPSVGERDRFYALLRGEARERGLALLLASQEMAALQGVGVLVSIASGELVSTGESGKLIPLPRARRAAERAPR